MGILLNKIFHHFGSVRSGSVDDEKNLPSQKVAVKHPHEANKGSGIEIALGELKKQMPLWAYRGSNPHMNASLTRDAYNGLEARERPSFADMGNKDKKTLVAVEKDSSRPSAGTKNPWQNFLFPSTHRLGVLLQGARLWNLSHQTQSSQESWHVLGVKRNAKRFSNQTSDARPRPQVRPKAVLSGGVMQHAYELVKVGRFEFRLGSRSLGGSEGLHARLTESAHPSKNRGSVQSHGMSDIFDADPTLGHSYRREAHLFQGLVTDGVTVLPGSDRHTNSVSWNPFEVYLTILPTIEDPCRFLPSRTLTGPPRAF